MRTSVALSGVLLALAGAVWALQGAGLVGGSFMSGQREWLVIGLACLVLGIGLLVASRSAGKP